MADLFIPKRIKVGFQERQGTFTGKLAYVTYYDEKNKLRKEKSWEGWRSKTIEPMEFDNEPLNGFIFNKGIQRTAEWFGTGRTVFRVYAPHDFEFEINADNLLNLLMHSDVSKREILEQCVFAWHGTELILLPVNSVEYQQSIKYTEKQSLKVSAKELVKGCRYNQKKSKQVLTYIGYFPWWKVEYKYDRSSYTGSQYSHKNTGKKHIFWDGSSFAPVSMSTLSSVVSDDVVDDYAHLVDKFFATKHSQSIKEFKLEPRIGDNDDKPAHYYKVPDMYAILPGNRVRQITTSSYYHESSFDRVRFYEQMQDITIVDGVSFTTTSVGWEKNQSYYYGSQYEYSREVSSDIKHLLTPLVQSKGYTFETLTPTQYVELMTELGFGKIKLVLDNNKEIKYEEYR